MEDKRVINSILGFRIHFCNVLCYEFDFMGRRFFSCRSVYHYLRIVFSYASIIVMPLKPRMRGIKRLKRISNTLKAIMFMWVGITTPLCFLGAYYGYKKRAIEHPGKYLGSILWKEIFT